MATVFDTNTNTTYTNNLTSSVLSELTAKLDAKAPKVTEVAIPDDASSASGDHMVENVVAGSTIIVSAHTPVRSVIHKESVHLRQDLQLHLRSVMQCGDDFLVKIRKIVEELDTAVHERKLAREELSDVRERHRIIVKQLEDATRECTTARLRLVEMSRQRDRAEVDLEAARGLLLERQEECDRYKEESRYLHIQIDNLTVKLNDYNTRLGDAEAKVRSYVLELRKLQTEIEKVKKELNSQIDISTKLGSELRDVRFENKELKMRYEKLNVELITLRSELDRVRTTLSEVQLELERTIVARDEANRKCEQAIKDRDVAIRIGEEAAKDAKDARAARDQAIIDMNMYRALSQQEGSLLIDAQKSLAILRSQYEVVVVEHSVAIEKAGKFEHLRDEALEQFHEADRHRHSLMKEMEHVVAEKKDIEIWLGEEKKKTVEAEGRCQVIRLEKEQVELRLNLTEREKNEAIARALKAVSDYADADKERDEAIANYEKMEDKYQAADKLLSVVKEERDSARKDGRTAREKEELMRASLQESKKSCEHLQADLKQSTEEVKRLTPIAAEAKKTADQLKEANTKLQDTTKQLQDTKNQLTPVQEQKGLLIRHIFWGGARIVKPSIYQSVIDSAFLKATHWSPNNTFFQTDPNVKEIKEMIIFYAVRQGDKLVDQMPSTFKESNTTQQFSPKGLAITRV